MNEQEINLVVLARIPDLNGSVRAAKVVEKCDSGRLLGQAISCKLLAGMMLFLLVGAAIPFSIRDKKVAESPKSPSDVLAVNRPAMPAAPSIAPKVADVLPAPVRPVVVIPAVPERAAAPTKIPMPLTAKPEPPVAASSETALMSNWSPPKSVGVDPGKTSETPVVNVPPPPVRPVEYQANVPIVNGDGSSWKK